jgi:hypothetical protein
VTAYCTREDVKAVLDVTQGTRTDAAIDRAIVGSTQWVEGWLNRRFYPTHATRWFDWPNYQYAKPWRLWLDLHEVISVESVTSGTVTIPSSALILRPENTGPPFSHIETRLDSGYTFGAGTSAPQQSISVTGWFGHGRDTSPAGALAAGISSSATTLTVTDGALIGVLDTLLIGDEYVAVTGRQSTSTAQTLQTAMTAAKNDTLMQVASGAGFGVGEVLTVDAERVRVIDIVGNALVVERAVDGTVLAAHTTPTIYASRALTVERGQWGTTAAAHLTGAVVSKHAPPSLVRDLTIAETLVTGLQHSMAWTSVKGDGGRAETLTHLSDLRDKAYTQYGRQARTRAI